jgi:hypothetical protein
MIPLAITGLSGALPALGGAAGLPTLVEAASEFAAIFSQELLKQAWKAGGFLSGGREAQAFYDQLSWEYSRIIARRQKAGLTDLVVKSLEGPGSAARASAPAAEGLSKQEGTDR